MSSSDEEFELDYGIEDDSKNCNEESITYDQSKIIIVFDLFYLKSMLKMKILINN